jgi:hypothetical protein
MRDLTAAQFKAKLDRLGVEIVDHMAFADGGQPATVPVFKYRGREFWDESGTTRRAQLASVVGSVDGIDGLDDQL